MKNLILFALACILLFACTPVEEPMTAEEKAQIKADVTDTFDKIIEDAKTLDIALAEQSNLFNDDYSTIMDGQISVGGDKAYEMFKGAYDYIEKYLSLEILELEVIVLDKNTSLIMNSFDEAYLTVTGDTVKVKGTGMYVMQLVEDKWMIVHLSGVHQPYE